MFHFNVMNKQRDHFPLQNHSSQSSIGQHFTRFCGLYKTHWSHFAQILEADYLDDGTQYKVENST